MDGLPEVNCCEDVTVIPCALQGLYRKTGLSGLHSLYFLLTVRDTVGMLGHHSHRPSSSLKLLKICEEIVCGDSPL